MLLGVKISNFSCSNLAYGSIFESNKIPPLTSGCCKTRQMVFFEIS